MKYLLNTILVFILVLPKESVLEESVGCRTRFERRLGGKCYYLSMIQANWFGAMNNCHEKGLVLADLANWKDLNAVLQFLAKQGTDDDFWFGGNDLQTEGRYQYISNGRLVRYFSNYSIIEPSEHSECDDCLKLGLKNITVIVDDNCLEKHYFVCSERYCDDSVVNAKKPRHHSHEHLHHFHHDIGDGSESQYDSKEVEEVEEGAVSTTPGPDGETVDITDVTLTEIPAEGSNSEENVGSGQDLTTPNGGETTLESSTGEEPSTAPTIEPTEATPQVPSEEPPEDATEAPSAPPSLDPSE